MMKQKIASKIEEAIKQLQQQKKIDKTDDYNVEVEYPREKNHGDYATNIALQISSKLDKKSTEIAGLIKSAILNLQQEKSSEKIFKKIEVAEPGFINLFLSSEILSQELRKILKKGQDYGKSEIGKNKKVVIDYSSPNIAKPFGIGHLRSTIIGQAIYNIYDFLDYEVIGDNHLGDWGTQFGKLLYAIEEWGEMEEIKKDPIKNLVSLYVKFHQEAEKTPELEEKGKARFKKLEDGDKKATKLWKKCVKWSKQEFDKIYSLLGVTFDYCLGESFYTPMLDEVITEALKKGVAEKSQGAVIIPFPDENTPPLLIRKSDGATLYSTRDLATIKYRRKEFKPDKIIYETGVDQKLYFKQLFWAAELMSWGKRDDYIHIAHGMMRLKGGKMSTRKGRTVYLEKVLNQAVNKAKQIIEKKNPDLKNKQKISKIVGIGAVKYSGLSQVPIKDIIFTWDKVLELQGNSGPYLQYSYVRAKSILRKSKTQIKTILKDIKFPQFNQKQESALLKHLIKFPDVILDSHSNLAPNLIANYLFDLSQLFNEFYEKCPVMESDQKVKSVRLALTESTAQIIKNGLNLLGINTVEKM